MNVPDELDEIGQELDRVVERLAKVEPHVPAHTTEAIGFLRAEIKVARRRLGNVRKVIASGTTRPPA